MCFENDIHRFIFNSRKRRHGGYWIKPGEFFHQRGTILNCKRRRITNEPLTSSQWKLITQPSVELSEDEMMDAMNSDDEERLLLGMCTARDLLNREQDAPADFIASTCIRLMEDDATSNRLHFDADWTLTCVATGKSCQTRCLIEHNAVPHFVTMLHSEGVFLPNEALQALALMAAEGAETCDNLIRDNVIDGILVLNNAQTPLEVLRNIVCLIRNLCQNITSMTTIEKVYRLLPVLENMLNSQDDQVLIAACWSVAYITSCDENGMIQAVKNANILTSLVRLLKVENAAIIEPVLRSVGNILKKSDDQTDLFNAWVAALPKSLSGQTAS